MEKENLQYERVIYARDTLERNFNIENGKYLFWSDDVNTEMPIVLSPDDDVPLKTIPQILRNIANTNPHNIAMRVKRKINPNDKNLNWINWSWD